LLEPTNSVIGENRLLLYFQITMGSAHVARVRALDALPGVNAKGVQLARRERTRQFHPTSEEANWFVSLSDGSYETTPSWQIIRAAYSYLNSAKPDAIILDQANDVVQIAIASIARRMGIRSFFRWATTLEDYPRHPIREWLKGLVYRGWDGYLATGSRAERYLQSIGVQQERIHLCGNPVNHIALDHIALDHTGATSISAPRNDRFLFVGRYIPHKNLPRLIDAYASYREGGGTMGLDIAGWAAGGEELKKRAEVLPEIAFHGHVDFEDLIGFYRTCAALVLPSISENWGLVVNEAMHTGAPVLLSDRCGCIPELLEEGGNGFSFDPFSVTSITDALFRFEAIAEGTRSEMASRSREIVVSQNLESWAKRIGGACFE